MYNRIAVRALAVPGPDRDDFFGGRAKRVARPPYEEVIAAEERVPRSSKTQMHYSNFVGAGVGLPVSKTYFHVPSDCFFQMET